MWRKMGNCTTLQMSAWLLIWLGSQNKHSCIILIAMEPKYCLVQDLGFSFNELLGNFAHYVVLQKWSSIQITWFFSLIYSMQTLWASLVSAWLNCEIFDLSYKSDLRLVTHTHLRDVCKQGSVELVDGVTVQLWGVGDELDQVGHRLISHVTPRLAEWKSE